MHTRATPKDHPRKLAKLTDFVTVYLRDSELEGTTPLGHIERRAKSEATTQMGAHLMQPEEKKDWQS
ncbi:hypothetical protein ACJX0J_020654, partial [Zea mays]